MSKPMPGDIVMILDNNYSLDKYFDSGDICQVFEGFDSILEIRLLYPSNKKYRQSDDLGYYNYKKMDTGLWRLL